MCDLETLKTIKEFFIASEQRVEVLKKNLVDYGVNESSSSSEEDQVDSLSMSPSEAGKKRKVLIKNRPKAEDKVSMKRQCKENDLLPVIPTTASVTGPVETRCVTARKSLDSTLDKPKTGPVLDTKCATVRKSLDSTLDIPRTEPVVDTRCATARKSLDSMLKPRTGPVLDTRSATARKSLDSTLDIQRIAETFESKHYGRKNVELEESKEELNHNQFPVVNPLKRPVYQFVVKAKSPKCRFLEGQSTSSVNLESGFRTVGEKKSPKLSASEVKLHRIAQTQTSGKPKHYCRSKVFSIISPHTYSANGISSVSFSVFDEHASSRSEDASSPKKYPFSSSYESSVCSPLMGGKDNAMIEKSMLQNQLQPQSAPENKLSNSDAELQTTQEPSNINTDTAGATGASLWPHRLRFYQNSRLSANFLPQANSFSYNWKANFKKTCNEYSVPYFDSHCHIDFLFNRQRFYGSWSRFKAVNQETFPDNFAGCVAVFCNPLTFKPEGLWKDVSYESDVWLAFGCHPKSATDFSLQRWYGLKDCLQHKKVVALGEIGLDYSGTFKQHMDIQKIVFRKQIQIALEMTKPLVIHCRDAEEDCLQILIEMVPKNYKIHCHCFTGDYAGAKRWLETFPSLYIGLTPMVTYRQCVQTHDVARSIPLNRLLLETDAPYFLPRKIPKEEMPFSHPGMAVTVAERVAYFQQCSVQNVLVACRNNMREMYGI